MYSLQDHGKMLADPIRMSAYLEALRRSVFPGCTVVDLGAGAGVFSLYACRWGARRVYAIEPDESIQLAKELAVANGYADRFIAMKDYSTNLSLPERADVIIADLRGVLPFFRRSVAVMIDARDRFLKTGGALIPLGDVLWGAIVSAPEVYAQQVDVWNQPGFEMSAARIRAVNTISKMFPTSSDLLSDSVELGVVDYVTAVEPGFAAHPLWTARQSGMAHGLAIWFSSTLAEGVSFSNGPGHSEMIYGTAFLPFSEPQRLETGDRITCQLKIDPFEDDYLWRWETTFATASGVRRMQFSQSSFHATLING